MKITPNQAFKIGQVVGAINKDLEYSIDEEDKEIYMRMTQALTRIVEVSEQPTYTPIYNLEEQEEDTLH